MSSAVKVVQPSGILDGIKGNQLRRDISDVVASGGGIVLIDLQNVTFMDSSGLSSLISAQRMMRAAGGKLFLCSINDQTKMLFELTKMDRVFQVFDDREEFNSKIEGS
ncbi:STAS domain-containing protein [Cyanobacteria bacterium FACHB-472]|nr:STAS domain-containing protein [Cyanobacteria bacterium FACHB-472]